MIDWSIDRYIDWLIDWFIHWESPYTLQRALNAINVQLKKVIAAINAIKKLIILQP